MSDMPPRQLFPNDGGLPSYESAPVMPAGFIQTDVVCAACRYNLRGQPREGRCPECGAPVMEAFRFGQLTFCDGNWLRHVRSGLVIGFWAILGAIVLTCIATSAILAMGFNPHSPQPLSPNQQVFVQVSGAVVWIPMMILGTIVIHRLTTPEPSVTEPGPFVRRGAARAAILLTRILIGVFVVNMTVNFLWPPDDPTMIYSSQFGVIYSIASMIAWYGLSFAIFILLFVHLRTIARRDMSPGLGRLFTFVIWGSSVNLLLIIASIALSILAMQALMAATAAAAATSMQAATQISPQAAHPIPTTGVSSHLTTTMSATFSATIHAQASRGSFATFDAILGPIMAVSGCFGLIWFILLLITCIQFYRALSKAITHNVGMGNVFAMNPPPRVDPPLFG